MTTNITITLISLGIAFYILIGILKLRYFDLNGDGDWITMWNDKRSCKSHVAWLWLCVILCWIAWPTILFSRKKYSIIDEQVIQLDKNGKSQLVKTGKKSKLLEDHARISIARAMFYAQWKGSFGYKNKDLEDL